ncbi:hypothetical protein KAM481_41220 [Aeromonas caviae]|nr:hypothetical protein KAM481_41220 [Aeromonas caviae]
MPLDVSVAHTLFNMCVAPFGVAHMKECEEQEGFVICVSTVSVFQGVVHTSFFY